MGPYGSQNFKTLLLLQITFESFQTFSVFSSQWSWQKYCFGFLKCTILSYGKTKNLNYLQTSDRKAKRSEIWASWVNVQCIQGTFKKRLRSFWGHLVHSDFRQACISKMASHRAKRSEIWASGWVFSVYRVFLTFKWLRSLWRHWQHFWFSTSWYLENSWS